MAKIMQGQVVDGYKYVGGDPANPESWVPVGPQVIPETSGEALASAAREEKGNPLAIGLGRFIDSKAMGAKQIALEAGKRLGMDNSGEIQKLSDEQAANTAAYNAYKRRFPTETSLGEVAPYAFMQGGPLGLAAKVGGMEALEYGSPQQRAAKGAVGAGEGFIAGAVGNAVSRYLNPPLNSMQRRALGEAKEMGIKPRLSQVTQSPAIARIEDAAARVPGGAGVFEDFNRANQVAINRAAAGSMGVKPDASGQVSEEVFQTAKQEFGRVYDAIRNVGKVNVGGRAVYPIQLDRGVASAADDVLRTQAKLGDRADQAVVKLAQQAKRMAGLKGRIDGEAYQLWHSNLTDASHTAFNAGESEAGKAYSKLMGALDDAAERSLRRVGLGGIADDLKAIRPKYANFKLMEKGTVAEAGDVSPTKVAQQLRTKNPDAFRTGRGGELGKLGRYAEAFPPLRAGSQTFERQMMSNPLEVLTYGGPAYIAAKTAISPMVTAVPGALGGTKAGAILGPAAKYGTRAGLLNVLNFLLDPQTPN